MTLLLIVNILNECLPLMYIYQQNVLFSRQIPIKNSCRKKWSQFFFHVIFLIPQSFQKVPQKVLSRHNDVQDIAS